MSVIVTAVGRPEVPPLSMPPRFRHEVTYFMTPGGEPGVPPLGLHEYWIRATEAQVWNDDGVLLLVSPLDSENKTEIELTEEQEAFLEWLLAHHVEHIRVDG